MGFPDSAFDSIAGPLPPTPFSFRAPQLCISPQEWFQSRYEWDLLAVRGLWAFGPELQVCINAVH